MGDSNEPDKVWDEYDWERFLQQQDRKTEKYMELLERFIDDPNRDQIIAREMGWYHLLDKDGEKWVENVDSLFDEEFEEDMEDDEATAMNVSSRVATMTRLKISRPNWSVPNQCTGDGGFSAAAVSDARGS